MEALLTYFSLGARTFAVPTRQVRGLRRRSAADAAQPGYRELDLLPWLGETREPGGKVIIVGVDGREVALIVDTITDLDAAHGGALPLPPLVEAAGYDPAVTGVLLLEQALVLVLDLEVLARHLTHMNTLEIPNGGL